jgi:hypothetical protein
LLVFIALSTADIGVFRGLSWVGEPNDYAKQMPAGLGLAKDIIYRIFSLGTRPLYQGTTKADFLNLLRVHTMPRKLFDPIPRPDEFPNRHR